MQRKPVIKLKLKTGGGAAPQPSASLPGSGAVQQGWAPQGAPPAGLHPAPSGSQQVQASSGAPAAAKQPFKFKVKVGAGRPKVGAGAAAAGAAARKGKPGRKKRAIDEFDFDFDSDEDYAGSPEARPSRRASKRSRADLKELRDLGIGDADLDEWDPEEPLVPRTWGLRSKHAADKAVTAPSSTGLGLSAGGPAPSDARTGAAAGAEAADTAGTDQLWGGLGDGGGGEGRRRMPAVPALSTGPPKREDFERLLVRCQKKDIHSMFKEPVTEAIAPGYFSVIKQPMDFSTMKTKASKGQYSTWDELRADMKLMFDNALTYNAQGGTVWNYAKLLAGQCDRIVELAMQGKTNLRASAMMTRKHNAAVKAQQKAERDKLRGQMRAEQRAAQEAKVLKKAGLASAYDEHDDENIRASYMRPVRDANVRAWRGLGAGTTSEGVAWGNGRQVLRPVNPWLPPGMYALSLARFAARLPPGRARELVMARARASTASDAVAERLLQQQLAKKVPLPPPMPTPTAAAAQAPAAVVPGAAAAAALPGGAARLPVAGAAAVPNAAAIMQAQQQLQAQLLAQQARPGGLPGMLQAGMVPGAAGMVRPGQPPGLPPGASVQLINTPQGLLPFLIQPGQPPMLLPTVQAAAAAAAAAGKPGMPGLPAGMQALAPGALMPGMPGMVAPGMVAPGMVQPRPAGK
ncbi:hypothetical protein COHA_003172 [Chlorella ohadii]|uniref:Bromo domain-containing protein n=1 Tax=Chlorella ohadii TaxID=2649997 RepID=A0AAD5DVH2_9CHLO|nr:hypothetical protein COHA_003172 [Chlorella ohadii]